MGKILKINEILARMGYENKGNVYYKTVNNKVSFVQEGETAFLEVVFEPGSNERMWQGKKIMNYFMKVVPVYPDWDNKKFEYGEQIPLSITATDYKFITEYIKPARGMIISARGSAYKNAKGFNIVGRRWGQIEVDKYFGSMDNTVGGDKPVEDDEFI